ncbi:hypothetical protein ACSSV8_003425, partial [Roseovarius sp. MBR-79]
CCNSDAVYMAATEIMPASTENLLPRGSHPYMVRVSGPNTASIGLRPARDLRAASGLRQTRSSTGRNSSHGTTASISTSGGHAWHQGSHGGPKDRRNPSAPSSNPKPWNFPAIILPGVRSGQFFEVPVDNGSKFPRPPLRHDTDADSGLRTVPGRESASRVRHRGGAGAIPPNAASGAGDRARHPWHRTDRPGSDARAPAYARAADGCARSWG